MSIFDRIFKRKPELAKIDRVVTRPEPSKPLGLKGSVVRCIALKMTEPETLYAFTWKGFLVSADRGNNWKELENGLPNLKDQNYQFCQNLHLSPVNNDILYLNYCTIGMFKSSNRGESWIKLETGLPVNSPPNSSCIDRFNPNILHALVLKFTEATVVANGVYRSDNGGLSWNLIKSVPTSSFVHGNVVHSGFLVSDGMQKDSIFFWLGGNDTLYRISNMGKSIKEFKLPFSIKTCCSFPHMIYLISNDGNLYANPGQGNSFTKINENPITEAYNIEDIVVDSGDKKWMFLCASDFRGRGGGIYITSDSGIHWERIFEQNTRCIAFDSQSKTLYAGTEDGIHMIEFV